MFQKIISTKHAHVRRRGLPQYWSIEGTSKGRTNVGGIFIVHLKPGETQRDGGDIVNIPVHVLCDTERVSRVRAVSL